MEHARLLPLILTLGSCCLIMGAAWIYSDRIASREAWLLRRFSGRPAPVLTPTDRRPSLRRDEEGLRWPRLLPAGISHAIAEFRGEMRGITRILFLIVISTAVLALNVALGANFLLALAVGVVLATVVWYMLGRYRLAKRLALIDEAIPEALDMIVRTLRVGLPIATAIQSVGRELTGPLAEEFTEAADRISYGQPVPEALREIAEKTGNLSLRYLAAAVSIQASSGGNLAEVLERLGGVARGRQQMRRKIRSITAEAKWSGRFLSMFPLLATMMILAINPTYFADIMEEPFFPYMLGLVGALLVMNMLFMRWLVNIE